MRIISMTFALALTSVVAGCSSTGTAVPSLAFGSVSGVRDSDNRLAGDALVTALNGGILADEARADMAPDVRNRALQAEYQALEYTPAGERVAWGESGDPYTGDVVASQPYRVGSQNCRQYTHTVYGGSAPLVGRGTACRNSDGSWTPLA